MTNCIAQTQNDSVSAAGSTLFKISGGRTFWMGLNYRKEWITPIKVPVVDISKEKGGLTVVKRGGGKQTRSLRVADPNGREYNFRSIQKFITSKTLPADLQLGELMRVVKSAVSENVPLMEALQQLRAMGYKQLPDLHAVAAGQWSDEHERALASLINMDAVRRVWIGSIEITELIRRKWQQELFSAAANGKAIRRECLWESVITVPERVHYICVLIPNPYEDNIPRKSAPSVQPFKRSAYHIEVRIAVDMINNRIFFSEVTVVALG